MNILDRLDDLDYRLGLRRRPGTAAAEVRPLSSGRVKLLRVIWGFWIVALVVTVIIAIGVGHWGLSIFLIGPILETFVMPADHRRQLLGIKMRVEGAKT